MNFAAIKLFLTGAVLVFAILVTWQVQQWRWEAKQKTALQDLAEQIENEAKKEADASALYEQKREATNELFKAHSDALQNVMSPSVVCFDPMRLRIVNAALSRKATNTTGLVGPVSGANAPH